MSEQAMIGTMTNQSAWPGKKIPNKVKMAASANSLLPKAWVLRQTTSLESVHGVLMPMLQFGSAFFIRTDMAKISNAKAGIMSWLMLKI